jgi:uncharacterized protein involved in outer membrane biogenesis
MKKWLLGFGIIFGLLLVGIFAIPLIINVDQYRPQLVEIANEKINGKLSLGRLKLSLWGQVRVDVEGLELKDASAQSILAVKEAYFHIPFVPLLSGEPVVTFVMDQPEVHMVKDKKGKLNVMSLVKGTSTHQEQAQKQELPTNTQTQDRNKKPLPSFVTQARLGMNLSHANLDYQDLVSGMKSEIKDLNFEVKNLSLSHPAEFKLWTKVHVKLAQALSLNEDFQLSGRLEPKMDSARKELQGISTSMKAQFLNAQLDADAVLRGVEDINQGSFEFSVKTNEVLLKAWADLLPDLKPYGLGGSFQFSAEAHGKLSEPQYQAQVNFKGVTFETPQLKAPGVLDGQIRIKTDQIESMNMTLKAPGNELKLQGKMLSFSKPQLSIDITSPGMDLDQWMKFEKKSSKEKASSQATSEASSSEVKTNADYDALLQPLRENPMMQNFVAQLRIQIAALKAQEVPFKDIQCNANFKDLGLSMDHCQLKVFSGEIQSQGGVQLKPKMPTYQMHLKVSHLDFNQAVQAQMSMFKNTVKGLGYFDMNLQGKSFNVDPAMEFLNIQGNLKVEQATFTTIDVMKMVREGLGQAISRVGDKIPALKGKQLGSVGDREAQYELISSDFSVAHGVFQAPHFQAKAVPQKGLDIRGKTEIKLKDLSVDAFWEVVDTYNLTHVRDISVDQLGVSVEHVFADGSAPISLPIHVGCKLTAPCYSYTEIPEYLTKIALKNVGKAASQRASQEAKKKAQEVIQQMAPPAVQEKLKRFFR